MRPQQRHCLFFLIIIHATSGHLIDCNRLKVVNGSYVKCRNQNRKNKVMKCDPFREQYFHKQGNTCMDCEKCLPGHEKISMEEWKIGEYDPETGPETCKPCRRCRPGKFSDVRAFRCKQCTNCTLYNKYEIQSCTRTQDSVCDGLITSEPSTSSTLTVPDTLFDNTSDERQGYSSLKNGSSTAQSSTFGENKSNEDSSSVFIAGIVSLVVSFIILGVILVYCAVSEKCRKRLQRKHKLPVHNRHNVDGNSKTFEFQSSPSVNTGYIPGTSSSDFGDENSKSSSEYCPSSAETVIQITPQDVSESVALSSKHRILGPSISENENQDLSIDGESNLRKKASFCRQWSYPMDGNKERDYFSNKKPILDNPQEQGKQIQPATPSYNQRRFLNHKDIKNVSKYLIKDCIFIIIGRELGLEDHSIDALKYDYRFESIQEQSYQTLMSVHKKHNIPYDQFRQVVIKQDACLWEQIENEF